MEELKIPAKLKGQLQEFSRKLKDIYADSLISLVVYGSAASGEFVERHSNLNIMVVLKDASLRNLKESAAVLNRFRMLHALFLSEDYINTSTDIFPIEFLDLQENHFLVYGKDILKGIRVDTRNLRFQCEQELKLKLLNLKQAYLKVYRHRAALRDLLLRSFTSVLHILRNVLRLKGIQPPYRKEEILRQLGLNFEIRQELWEKILAAKARRIKLGAQELEAMFCDFILDLEKLVGMIDKM